MRRKIFFRRGETLIGEGADILELGVPFSDPVADGAVIRLPVVAGFGIRTPEEGARIAVHCDGFVIGSALVERFMS